MRSREKHLAWFTVLPICLWFIAAHAQGSGGQGNLKLSPQSQLESTPAGRDSKAMEGAPTQSAPLSTDILNRELKTIDGRVLKLADYPGKIIVVNLFASWCGPCRMNLADLIHLKESYQDHVQVIGLVAQETDPDVAFLYTFLQQQDIDFPVVLDDGGFGESLVKTVNGRNVLPQTFVIDKDGCIRSHYQGYSIENSPQLLRKALDQIDQKTK